VAKFDPTWIDDAMELVEGSPVRRARDQGRAMPEPAALDSVDEIPRRLAALRERVAKPLTLAVLGEVKAGKSTLVNALVGADVAPVDVLEATQWVMEIQHGSTARASLRFTDGSSREGTPQEVHDLLFAERQNPDFVSRCAEVMVTLPQQTLTRLHLIDTPGLATVTEEAAARTRHYLSKVDAVLWVLNANHLGQMDVSNEMADVARTGKPVFAVINRIDEVEADPDRLVRYVQARLAEYVEDVFAVSARTAREAQRDGDEARLQASGLPELRTFLEERIDRQASEVQAQALSQQLQALLQLEQTLHETYAHQLAFLIRETEGHLQRLEIEKHRIQNEAEMFIEDQLDAYFRGVANEFISRIPAPGGLDRLFGGSMGRLVEIWENELQSALGGDRFAAWAEELAPKVETYLRDKWREATGQMEVQLRERFQTFYAGEVRRLEAAEGLDDSSDILEGLKQGLTTGGVIGAGLAAYAAAIGPGAAYITMGTALGAFLPPALIVGAVAGLLMRFLQSGRQVERLRASLRDVVTRHKRVVRSEWVEPTVLPAVAQYNAAIAKALAKAFTEKLCQGWSMDELKTLAYEVGMYLTKCQETRQEIHQKAELSAD